MFTGDAGVGKTSLTRRFVDGAFEITYVHTIGVDFHEKVLNFEDSSQGTEKVRLQIWDTAGQERSSFYFPVLIPLSKFSRNYIFFYHNWQKQIPDIDSSLLPRCSRDPPRVRCHRSQDSRKCQRLAPIH